MFSYHRFTFTDRERYARAVRRFFDHLRDPNSLMEMTCRGRWETPGTWYIEYCLHYKTPAQI